MTTTLAVEWLKLRRSAVFRLTTALFLVAVPAAAVGFVLLARSPGVDSPTRAKLAAYAVGEVHVAQVSAAGQVLSVAMVLGGGFVVAWLYGREFADRTIGSLYGLPVDRGRIALAKSAVAVAWVVAVSVAAVGVTLLASWATSPTGFDLGALAPTAGVALVASVLSGLLAMPFGWVATVVRGYFGALAAIILLVMATQIIVTLGAGGWFPYAAPSLWAGMAGADAAALIRPVQLALVPAVGAAGVALTVWWWRRMQVAAV